MDGGTSPLPHASPLPPARNSRRAQALTVPRAIMLFSALLMAILIVRMVGYHYTVSDRQQETFRFMLKASDIGKKLISSSECLSHETFLYRGVIEKEKLDSFAENYSRTEPPCAYDYDLGWRAKVTEKSFTYVSPAVLTTLNFAPGNWMNASELVLITAQPVNITITNSTGESYQEEVLDFRDIPMYQEMNFSSPHRLWAISRNYPEKTPRENTQIATVGPNICYDELDDFILTSYSNADPSGLLSQTDSYQAIVFTNSSDYVFLQDNKNKWKNFLSEGKGIVVFDDNFDVWEDIFDQSPISMGFHSACEIPGLEEDCNLTSGLYLNYTVTQDVAELIDISRGKTPGDLISMYGLNFRTYVYNKLWIIPQFENTQIRITDLSDGDDFADLHLDVGESRYLDGFEHDVVSVEASRPIWTIAGDAGGYTWLQGNDLMFPSFGSFAIIAPHSTTFSITPTDTGDYTGGETIYPSTGTLQEGGMFRLNKTQESGFRWVRVNSTLPVIVETWSDHGMVQKISSHNGNEYEIWTMGLGNITICPGGHAVAIENGEEIYPYNPLDPKCSEVSEKKEYYHFTSDEPFLMIQSLGGDGASQIIQPQDGDDIEAAAIAQLTDSEIIESDSQMNSYNLFYIYRATYPVNLPPSHKGVILLYNSPEIFSQFGITAHPVFSDCIDWSINKENSVFSTPLNITEEFLEANPFQGCTFFHTFPVESEFASSPDHDLERIVDFEFRNGEPVMAASLKPYHTKQLPFVKNLAQMVTENIFTKESIKNWEFGSLVYSVGPAKRQEITLRLPVAIYYNDTKVKPGEMELRVVDGEFEQVRGILERVCMENITEITELHISYPFTLEENNTLCQSDSCKTLICPKQISLDLNAGFRIIKVSSNETGVFMG
jgi:hypothetical protein